MFQGYGEGITPLKKVLKVVKIVTPQNIIESHPPLGKNFVKPYMVTLHNTHSSDKPS